MHYFKSSFFIRILCVVIAIALPVLSFGQEDLVRELASKSKKATDKSKKIVSKIKVSGNKKIEQDAILSKIPLKSGSEYDSSIIRESVQSVFDMGFFYNVEVVEEKANANTYSLEFKILEKPSITEIRYEGNDEISEDDLAAALGIKLYEILNYDKAKESAEKLQKLYEDKGFFLAKVNFKFEEPKDLEQGAVLRFIIEENDKVEVKSIQFIGNESLSDDRLKSVMLTQEGGFFSFMGGSGAFKQDMFDHDMQMINLSYFNEGYIQVKIDRPEVSVTPDKKGVYITIKVEEGDQFSIGNIDFNGEILFTKDELRAVVKITESEVFSYSKLEADLSSLQAKFGDLGYAFANINPKTRFRPEEKKVDIIFDVDKGEKVYFGEINITGNLKTRDKVLRREIVIVEGELFNETKKRESLANIKRLGFFDDVNFKQKTNPKNQEILDVEISVKERNTGSLQVGAGYSSNENFVFNAQVTEQNLFGKGQKLGLDIKMSNVNRTFRFSLTEPYFRDTKWSLGGEVFQVDNLKNEITQYSDLSRGAALRVGYPLEKFLRVYMSVEYEDMVKVKISDKVDSSLYPLESVLGDSQIVSGSLEYDSRDDRFSPSAGQYANVSLKHAGFSGDIKYNTLELRYKVFKKVFWDVVLRNNFAYDYLWNTDGSQLPFTKLYLLGGSNSLKGYSYGDVGTRVFDSVQNKDVPYGAPRRFFYNLELEFPLVREANIKGVVFYDMGNAEDNLDLGDLQKDYGFGFRWFSPIGPLRFEWGYPINPKSYHSSSNFEFSIGTPF